MPAASQITAKACPLPLGAVEHDRAGFLARGVEPLLRARPHDGLLDDAAVVADGVHGDDTGAASTVEMLTEALIGVLSLVVAVRAD